MSEEYSNSVLVPKAVIDSGINCLNEQEIKSVLIYYRHAPNNIDEALKSIGSDRNVLDDAMMKMGHMTESKAISIIKEMAEENQEALSLIWCWGDGLGGAVIDYIGEAIEKPTQRNQPLIDHSLKKYKKKRIPLSLSKAVFERDAYRCVSCGNYIDLTCDHIIPESKGGDTSYENLQTMCRSCNSQKGAKTTEVV